MPTVLRYGKYRFFFYSHEGNEPAHIHVVGPDSEAKFWLIDCTLACSWGLPPHEIHELLLVVKKHQEKFLEAWHEHHDSIS